MAVLLALTGCAVPKVLGDSPTESGEGGSSEAGGTAEPTTGGQAAACQELKEEAACLGMGCSEFTTIAPWTVVDGECVQGPAEPLCLWFDAAEWGGPATPGSFYEVESGRAVQFATDWIDPPHGWAHCGDPESPPACACISTCALAQMQAHEFLDADLPCEVAGDCVLVDALCYEGNVCGSVAVNQASVGGWGDLAGDLGGQGCCAGADPCGGTLACEAQRCVVQFSP